MKKLLTLFILLSSFVFAQTEGTIKWTFEASDKIQDTPAIADDGTIYTCSRDGIFYALNSDGTLKWTYEAHDEYTGGTVNSVLTSAPAIGHDGTIYFGSAALGKFFAINPDSTEKWTKDFEGVIRIPPAVAPDGSILVANSMGELVALNPADGTEKWNVNVGTSYYSSPAIDANGVIFVNVKDGSNVYLKAISADGVEIWEFKIGSGFDPNSSPAIGKDGTIYVGSENYNLYAVNPDGTEKWKYFTDAAIMSSPVIASDGTIYIHSSETSLYAINPDGTEKWKSSLVWGLYSNFLVTPAVGSDGVIYTGGTDANNYASKAFAVNHEDGTIKWELSPEHIPFSSATITKDGAVLISGDDILYAINSSSTGLANSPWPKNRKDYKNTGFTTVATSVKQIGVEVPQEYLLSQNYPNPFNPSTTISFAIPEQADVKLSIYNSIGEEVAELLNDNISAGFHEINFDASNLSSGLYFYKISSSNFVDVKKMLLLK